MGVPDTSWGAQRGELGGHRESLTHARIPGGGCHRGLCPMLGALGRVKGVPCPVLGGSERVTGASPTHAGGLRGANGGL